MLFTDNRGLGGLHLEPRSVTRNWWIDEGGESPIVVVSTITSDSDLDWFDTSDSILASLAFGDAAPNPAPPEGDLWTLGFSLNVPAGLVEVPALGGLRFEIPEEQFVHQHSIARRMVVFLDDEAANSEFLFIDRNLSDDPIATAQDAIEELVAIGVEVTELETTTIGGFPTRVVDVASEQRDVFRTVDVDGELGAWAPPLAGRLWFIESDRGLLLATAETFTPSAPLERIIAQTTWMVSTLEFIELN